PRGAGGGGEGRTSPRRFWPPRPPLFPHLFVEQRGHLGGGASADVHLDRPAIDALAAIEVALLVTPGLLVPTHRGVALRLRKFPASPTPARLPGFGPPRQATERAEGGAGGPSCSSASTSSSRSPALAAT